MNQPVEAAAFASQANTQITDKKPATAPAC
jgi:hypothetical protein